MPMWDGAKQSISGTRILMLAFYLTSSGKMWIYFAFTSCSVCIYRSMWKALRSTNNSSQTRGSSIVVSPDTDNQFQGSYQSHSTIYRAGIVFFSVLHFSLVLCGENFHLFLCYALNLAKEKLSISIRLNALSKSD